MLRLCMAALLSCAAAHDEQERLWQLPKKEDIKNITVNELAGGLHHFGVKLKEPEFFRLPMRLDPRVHGMLMESFFDSQAIEPRPQVVVQWSSWAKLTIETRSGETTTVFLFFTREEKGAYAVHGHGGRTKYRGGNPLVSIAVLCACVDFTNQSGGATRPEGAPKGPGEPRKP